MAMKRRRLVLLALMAAALFLSARPRLACGPFVAEAIFTYSMHPDLPLDRFAAGQLGVLEPSYARSYLAVAYRYLSADGLDKTEQKAVVTLWNERLDLDNTGMGGPAPSPEWTEARKEVPGVESVNSINVERPVNPSEPYTTYLNCAGDAFDTAIRTLKRLIAAHGAGSPEVKEWLAAQDQVFSNCGGGQTIPSEAPANASAEVKADRAYQIAAANFYSANFEEAERRFDRIASDTSSPWRTIAPYLAVRAIIRKATLSAPAGETDKALLDKAETRLERVLADPTRAEVHSPARGLLRFVLARSKREQALRDLASAVLKKSSGQTLEQDLADYTWVMDKLVSNEEDLNKFDALPKVGREDDLTDWVFVFQATDRKSFDYSLQRWNKTSSLPWLVAAISKCEAGYPQAAALIESAAKIRPGTPAYATLSFHRLRLMVDSGKSDEARKQLDAIIDSKGGGLPPSARNLFLSLRAALAANLDEFLKYAQRVPAGLSYNEDGRELPFDPSDDPQLKPFTRGRVCFDSDSATALNRELPLALLKQAASSQILPVHLRREVALAAWVRAVLLDDDQTALDLASLVQTTVQALKGEMTAYVADQDNGSRRFGALLAMLRFPGMGPIIDTGIGRVEQIGRLSSLRDNWWCAVKSGPISSSTGLSDRNPPPDLVRTRYGTPLAFLSAGQKAAAASELKKLSALGTAPNYLCEQVIKWAGVRPDDPRIPEALHLAVRSTRYGCTDSATGSLSKQAFDLLHRKYPKSPWAEKTKYWFKG